MRGIHDESGVIVSWLVKLLVFFAIIGTALFDFGSIIVNDVTLDSSADQVAIAVSLRVGSATPQFFSDEQIFQFAREEVKDPEEGVSGAKVLRKGTNIDETGVVHIKIRREAKTFVTKYIGPLEHFTFGTGSGQASTD
jgi:hypothetical protein